MLTAKVMNWTSVVGTNVPFVTTMKTNNKITNDNGTFTFLRTGLYDIDANLVISGVTGEVIASVYVDGAEDGVYAETTLTADVTVATLPLTDAIKVVMASYPNVATIGIRIDTAGVNVSGNIRLQYEQ